jgi:repressor LexA
MKPITKRQTDVLQFILSYQEKEGYVPSLTDIQSNFSWTSRTAALWHMKALVVKGYISESCGRARAYRVLKRI